MRATVLVVWTMVLLAAAVPPAASEEVTIAAASDLNFAFKDVIAAFESGHPGLRVKLTLGSSGNFYSQITNGAPFDLYFSADIGYPKKLEEAGLTRSGSLYRYAVGRIVLWVPTRSGTDPAGLGMQALLAPSVRKIAIANPKHAPYGRAAVAAMKHFQVYEAVSPKLVLGENVSQAAQFVESGAADVGIVALSLALAPSMQAAGRYWEVPAEAHPPIEQGAVILKSAKNVQAAERFLEFLRGPEGRAIMARYGFTVPE